jgi:WD40 repeat protein
VRLWDLHTGEAVLRLTGHTAPVSIVRSVTLDGKPYALTGADDHTVRIWNLRTGECTYTLGVPLAATAVDNRLIICFANDMALFER